jgi:hypothetical protein
VPAAHLEQPGEEDGLLTEAQMKQIDVSSSFAAHVAGLEDPKFVLSDAQLEDLAKYQLLLRWEIVEDYLSGVYPNAKEAGCASSPKKGEICWMWTPTRVTTKLDPATIVAVFLFVLPI